MCLPNIHNLYIRSMLENIEHFNGIIKIRSTVPITRI